MLTQSLSLPRAEHNLFTKVVGRLLQGDDLSPIPSVHDSLAAHVTDP